MEDDKYLEIESRRIAIEEQRFELENTIFKRNFGVILTAIAAMFSSILGLSYSIIKASNTEAEATIAGSRIARDATLSRGEHNQGSLITHNQQQLINSAGTLYYFGNSTKCGAHNPIPILSDGSIALGLESTLGQESIVQIKTFGEVETIVSVPYGGIGVFEYGDSILNISISHVGSCSADYRVWVG